MSEFLVIKSAQEQRLEGIEFPIDTAYISESHDGKPVCILHLSGYLNNNTY